MICCVCGNKQSMWLEDFPLSDSHPELRTCAKCHDRQTNLISKIESDEFPELSDSFSEWLMSQKSASDDVKKNLSEILECAKDQHQQWEDKQNAQRHLEESKRIADESIRKSLENILITTTFSLEGYHISQYVKMISGISVIGTGVLSEFKASLSDIFGVESEALAKKMNEAKEAAELQLKKTAISLGANAVIGTSISYAPFSANIVGVLITGTAVKLAPTSDA